MHCFRKLLTILQELAITILTTCVQKISKTQDQCSKLNARCTADSPPLAYNLSSSSDDPTAEHNALDRIPAQSPHLVFCTPERLATASFLKQLQCWHAGRPFAYIVVDEAHLVAEQGHTFRPDYLRLGELRAALPDLAVLCFSATCNEFVRQCLCSVLALRAPRLFDANTSLVSKLCTTFKAKVIFRDRHSVKN